MQRLVRLHAEGAFHPVVGETLPFSRIRDAHTLAGGGHKRGSVVLLFPDPASKAQART
jgi:NADPH:quinone reductase-like Zn-dependent oxidoreductase